MKRRHVLRFLFGLIPLVVFTLGAYYFGKSQNQDVINGLKKQIESLPGIQQDAAVVKRVSKQMEDIAYQQKEISDKQRAKADEQADIANQMRLQAEQEKTISNQARAEAQLNAHHADSLRKVALHQMGLAESSKNEALHAKRVSDTVSFRTLARSLASAGMAQYTNGFKDQGRFLAYKAWEFTCRYDGNEYQPEIFMGLLNTGEMRVNYSFPSRGAVKGICLIEKGGKGILAVSDYGDICLWKTVNGKMTHSFMLKDPSYNFVDVCSTKNYFYALTQDGKIYYSNFTPFKGNVLTLVGNHFQRITPLSNGNLLISSNQAFYFLDTQSHKIIKQMGLSKKISCVAELFPGTIQVFFEDGTTGDYALQGQGKVIPKTLPIKEKVTCCTYSSKYDVIFLGTQKGTLLAMNKTGKRFSKLIGHNSALTGMEVDQDVLISTAYDKQIIIWNLPKLQEEGKFFVKNNRQHNDWITLMTFSESSWPLSLCMDKTSHQFLVGFGNGTMSVFSYEINAMAKDVKSKITKNLTPQEWNQYVGSGIPFEKVIDK